MHKKVKHVRSAEEIAASIKKWQQRSASERLEDTMRLSLEAYGLTEAPLMDKTLVRIKRTPDSSDG